MLGPELRLFSQSINATSATGFKALIEAEVKTPGSWAGQVFVIWVSLCVLKAFYMKPVQSVWEGHRASMGDNYAILPRLDTPETFIIA